MVYARVHDQTVAEDYFKAMEQVEERLALHVNPVKCPFSTSELLVLVDSLQGTTLNLTQREIVSALHSGLTLLAGQQIGIGDVKVLIESG